MFSGLGFRVLRTLVFALRVWGFRVFGLFRVLGFRARRLGKSQNTGSAKDCEGVCAC